MISPIKKMLMVGYGARPFTRSGSFETSEDGWVLSNAVIRSSIRSRTGEFSLRFRATGPGASYSLTSKEASGLNIRCAAFFNRSSGISVTIRFFVDNQQVKSETLNAPGGDNVWTELASTFRCPRGKGISIRIDAPGNELFMDDWSISGSL